MNAPAQRRCLLFRFEQYQLCHHLRLQQFYDRLLAALRAPAMHDGDWRCSNTRQRGMGTGPWIVLSRTFGKERIMDGISLW